MALTGCVVGYLAFSAVCRLRAKRAALRLRSGLNAGQRLTED